MVAILNVIKMNRENEMLSLFPQVHSIVSNAQTKRFINRKRNRCLKVLTFVALEGSLGMSLACTALYFCVLMAVVLWVFVEAPRHFPYVIKATTALSHVLPPSPPPVLPLLLTPSIIPTQPPAPSNRLPHLELCSLWLWPLF